MKQVKFFVMFAALSGLILYSSCKDETKDIGEKIDTVASKIGQEVDTLAKDISDIGVDSIFRNVEVTEVDTAGMAGEDFRGKLNEVFNDYEDIKEALAENDTSGVIMQSNQLRKSLQNVEDDNLNEKMMTAWVKSSTNIDKAATEIASAKTIAGQRKGFSKLTNEMLALIKTYGLHDMTVYYLECKGASGGSWLTDSRNTDNPYSGGMTTSAAGDTSEAQDCATVKEALKFN